ncbi:hypothetical protein CCYA_CCYA18G4508 [Cyanidiococcus yangmingshanensis]|nr:hypothetical protein CCYA_CCYA18G4508 [Cyanidiococcus yangmingshanensis]
MRARNILLTTLSILLWSAVVEAVSPTVSPAATPSSASCAALFTEELPACVGDILQVPGVLATDLLNAARYCASTVVSLIVCAAQNIGSIETSCAPDLTVIRACVQAAISNSTGTR